MPEEPIASSTEEPVARKSSQRRFAKWLIKEVPQAESKLQNFFRGFVSFLFRPIKLEYGRQFYWVGLVIVFLVFVSLIILALPWTIKNVTEGVLSNEYRNYLSENKDWLKTWLGFISFLFEIFIAFSIGGILFTEPVVARLKKTLEDAQKNQAEKLAKSIPQERQELLEIGNEAISLQEQILLARANRMRIGEYIKKNYQLYTKIRVLLSRLYPGLPFLYLRFVMLKFVVNFPGGLYGFTAFLMFFGLSVVKIINQYLDSPWLKVTTNSGT